MFERRMSEGCSIERMLEERGVRKKKCKRGGCTRDTLLEGSC